ncbi:MAG: hypothetical protein AAF234_11490 [Pseudomonadota bacterium]
MILGTLELDPENAILHTAKDSYTLKELTTVSVRQPFLPAALIFSAGLGAIGVSFFDILYAHERAAIPVFILVCLAVGVWAGRLKLRSRELHKGDELADTVWGSFPALNKKRRDIIRAAAKARGAAA